MRTPTPTHTHTTLRTLVQTPPAHTTEKENVYQRHAKRHSCHCFHSARKVDSQRATCHYARKSCWCLAAGIANARTQPVHSSACMPGPPCLLSCAAGAQEGMFLPPMSAQPRRWCEAVRTSGPPSPLSRAADAAMCRPACCTCPPPV